jgi:predicted alpha-1,2-mannosidase
MLRFYAPIFFVFGLLINVKSQTLSPIDQVNPNIGGIGHLLQPTVPLVSLPNSMMRVHRMPGSYESEFISGFPIVLSGHRMPATGLLIPTSGNVSRDRNTWKSRFDHELEKAKPNYYSVWLQDHDCDLDFTVGEKSAFYRVTWNKRQSKNLMLGLSGKGKIAVKDKRTVEGYELHMGKVKVYFYIQFEKDFLSDSLWIGNQPMIGGIQSIEGDSPSARLTFDIAEKERMGFKVGVSYIDVEQARRNLIKDIPAWDFAKLEMTGREAWNKALGKIKVNGATSDQTIVFYTALYRTYERMVNISEGGRYYSAYDSTVHNDGGVPFFVDDWMWDTYHAAHPLQAMLNPELEGNKIQSYVRIYEQGGWIPSFPLLWGDHPCMNGHHSAAIIADAYFKGIRNFNVGKAYEGLKKNAMEATMVPWTNGPMCSLDSFYLEKGYFPALNIGEKETVSKVHHFEKRQAVALTLGHSFDDWCLAQLAQALGKTDDYKYFISRSKNYRKLFNSASGFFEPKNADGNWIKGFDPKLSGGMGARDYYDENNGWTYLWQVEHDVASLVELLGGREKFTAKLDQLFIEEPGMSKNTFQNQFPDATGLVGQFVMGNEPSMHIPYLYNYAGQPWKTQRRVRMLLDTWFTNSPFGIPGDEDGGGLSAFVVFSSMGLYPVTPGNPAFNICSPIFKETTIQLNGGKTLKILAPKASPKNKYIQSVKLNGKPWNKPWLSWDQIKEGGEILIELAEKPNYKWGSDVADAPPSETRINPK